VTDPGALPPSISFIRYDTDTFEESVIDQVPELASVVGKSGVKWINVDGLGDADVLRQLGDLLKLHGLALEDVVNTHQRPKGETYEDHVYVVSRVLAPDSGSSEQLSLFLWRDMVVTFRERPNHCFEPVRTRLREQGNRIRKAGADYLAYALLDANVDTFFPALDHSSDVLEMLEDEVVMSHQQETLRAIFEIRHRLADIRRMISPLREVANFLIRDTGGLVRDDTRLYLRDLYDHTVQLMEIIEAQRDVAAGLLEIYLSSVSNRKNEVMKILTIIATMFIPLTFLVGVYGMNFDTRSPWNMPELRWHLGYPILLLVMLSLVVLELYLFKHMGWIGRREKPSAKEKQAPH
jgi:magnesium transporter